MKNQNFPFFMAVHAVFSRYGHWPDVLWRSRTDFPLIGSLARVGFITGPNEGSHAEHPVPLGNPCLGNLTIDNAYFSRKLSESTVYWDGSHWQDRLKKIVSVGTLDDFQQFLKQTVDPAFQELRQEFLRNGISVHIQGSDDSQTACRELIVESGSLRNFIYGIRYRANDVSDTVVGSLSFPTITEEEDYEPICYFADGRRGYSIKYMQKDELITDVLRQYERYVKMLAAGKHDLYLTDKVHPGQGGKS